jgi:HD-like signal output (HDOD) protein
MSSWIHRVGALFGGQATAPKALPVVRPLIASAAPKAAAVVPRAAMPTPATSTPDKGLVAVDSQPTFFEWLVGTGPLIDMPLRANEQRMLVRLDATLASDASRNALLPRAPAVIPQLLNSLRDENQSSESLAQRVAKDPLLVAEVIRLANSVHYGSRNGEAAQAGDLPRAISRIGIEGLRRAIARVVLKPIFDAQADPLSARTTPRLWLHSEAKAAECMRLCRAAGVDPFEGYLAGLMHNIGWTAALRVIGRSETAVPTHFSKVFVQAFESRCESFFAMLVMPWDLTDSITALAVEMLDGGGLAASRSPLGQALLEADRNAAAQMLAPAAVGELEEALA